MRNRAVEGKDRGPNGGPLAQGRDWSAVDIPVNTVAPRYLSRPPTAGAPPTTPVIPGTMHPFPNTIGLDPTKDYPDYPASITPRQNPVTEEVNTPFDTPPMTRTLGTGSARGLTFRGSLGEIPSPLDQQYAQYDSKVWPWVFPSVAGGIPAVWPKYGYSRNVYSPATHWRFRRFFAGKQPIPAVNRNVQKAALMSVLTVRRGTNPTGGRTTRGAWTGNSRPRGVVTEWPLVQPQYDQLGVSREIT